VIVLKESYGKEFVLKERKRQKVLEKLSRWLSCAKGKAKVSVCADENEGDGTSNANLPRERRGCREA
jgi:hypothetical protein